tara:strand:+ start:1423 stop:1797 length:375 start_codon:yes stop_codon:yes gene_type:complete
VATVKAAITGEVNDCNIRIKNEPIPKPVAPIQKPLTHLAFLTSLKPSIASHIKKIRINEKTFRAVITLTTSQSFNKYSAAGNPVANSRIEKTHRRFDLKIAVSLLTLCFEADVGIELLALVHFV